jgi:hypothetical protein
MDCPSSVDPASSLLWPLHCMQGPFQARQEEGRLRLLALLQRCMIRSSKEELWNLPHLHRKVADRQCGDVAEGAALTQLGPAPEAPLLPVPCR